MRHGRLFTIAFGVALLAGALRGAPPASAGPGGPVQDFVIDGAICYGTAPFQTLACPAGSATSAPASSAAANHIVSHIQTGSRLGAPIVYTPGSFAFNPGAVLAPVGDVTAQIDLQCDGTPDVVSGGNNPGDPVGATGNEGALEAWPNTAVWRPFPVVRRGVAPAGADAYVTSIKPTPPTFTPLSYDRADLYSLWLTKSTAIFLPVVYGASTPLNSVTEEYPPSYGAGSGLKVSLSLFLGNYDAPTNSFVSCLDSSQDSIQTSTQWTTPAVPGMYARWTAWTSNADVRGGNVARVIDLACVRIGGFADTDADGDCLPSGTDPDDNVPDADGDLIVDGIEAEFGTSRTDADADLDGATDFEEMLGFTNPGSADTDGDGSADKRDTGADENTGLAGVQDTTADDNCPAIANATQANADSANDFGNAALSDPTNPSQDPYGDACDLDDDNDGIADTVEAGLHILPPSVTNTSGWCKRSTAGGAVLQPTNALDPDTDKDLGLDGAECKFDTNPQDFGSRLTGATMNFNSLAGSDSGIETFYRTQKINKPGGGQEDNPDGDGFLTGDADGDSDNDGLQDGAEVKYYGTHPSNDDSDNDGCKDGTEAASVNGDRSVNATDLSQTAQRFQTNYLPANDGAAVPVGRTNYDFTRDRNVNATDLSQIAQRFTAMACPDQAGLVTGDSKQ